MKFSASGGGSSSPFLIKLKGGESVTGVLRGDPLEYEHAFKEGDKPKFRFRINMVVNENNGLVCKILEGGWKLYIQLKQFSEAGWDLEKSFTKISRQGTTMNDTTYSATVLPNPVGAETLAKLASVPMQDLTPHMRKDAQESQSREPGSDDFGVGF